MFRDEAAGGFCMANPKLDVSNPRLVLLLSHNVIRNKPFQEIKRHVILDT